MVFTVGCKQSGLTNDDMYGNTTVDVSEVFYMDGNDYVEGYVYQASEDVGFSF